MKPNQDVFTVITMYRGHDAEMFCHVVQGELTEAQRAEWRKTHDCDGEVADDDDHLNNMFFRTVKPLLPGEMADLFNVDGEGEDPTDYL
jgi:hypothetical protein